MSRPIDKSESEWLAVLTPEQFRVTRQKGTERPFTGEYCDVWTHGTYCCVCCGAELFHSDSKFDSGSGWPSFFTASDPDNIDVIEDHRRGTISTEVICQQCGAYLGLLFEDGPNPTGLRYCINSAALTLDKG